MGAGFGGVGGKRGAKALFAQVLGKRLADIAGVIDDHDMGLGVEHGRNIRAGRGGWKGGLGRELSQDVSEQWVATIGDNRAGAVTHIPWQDIPSVQHREAMGFP
jgi:hypothetical protein